MSPNKFILKIYYITNLMVYFVSRMLLYFFYITLVKVSSYCLTCQKRRIAFLRRADLRGARGIKPLCLLRSMDTPLNPSFIF